MTNIYKLTRMTLFLTLILLATTQVKAVPPDLILPENNEGCISLNADFEWSNVTAASWYEFQIATDIGFNDLVVDENQVQARTYEAQLPNNDTEYFWRVKSYIIGDPNQDWSEPFRFVTKKQPATLLSPADEIICSPLNTTFSWEQYPNAVSYRIQISENVNFTNLEFDSTDASFTSIEVNLSEYFTDYFWRIQARIPGCDLDWSAARKITTIVGPPELVAPGDSAVGQDFFTVLDWNSQPGASSYQLQVSDDENFNNIILDEEVQQQTSWNFESTEYNAQYWWRVRTNNANCDSEWSTPYTFKTYYEQTSTVEPINGQDCVPIRANFVWQEVPNAQAYTLQVSKTNDFINPDYEISDIQQNNFQIDLGENTTLFYWRVKAEDNLNEGIWSETKSFETSILRPVLQTPNQQESPVLIEFVLNWLYQSSVERFNVQISRDSNFTELVVNADTVNDKKLDVLLEDYGTTFYWRVSAFFDGCSSAWSDVFTFTTIQGYPDLISPIGGQQNIPVTANLIWDNVPTADSYDLRIASDPEFNNVFYSQFAIEATNFNVSGLNQNTTYYWQVRSNNQWGKTPWSPVGTFQTGQGNVNTPFLLSPPNLETMVDLSGELVWRRIPSANKYTLQLATDEDFENIIMEDSEISDTTYNYTDLDNYTEYWWRVSSRNNTTESDFSEPFRFRTIALAPQQAPVGISPEQDEEIPNNQWEFEWTSVPGANIGGANDAGYELQINDSDDFSGGLVKSFPRVYEETGIVRDLIPDARHYWRVRAWNEAGNGPWSATFEFTTFDVTSVAAGKYQDMSAGFVPNPSNGENAVFEFNSESEQDAILNIYDQNGNLIFSKNNISANGYNRININLDNLSSGMYLFNLQVGNTYQTGKLVITK